MAKSKYKFVKEEKLLYRGCVTFSVLEGLEVVFDFPSSTGNDDIIIPFLYDQ